MKLCKYQSLNNTFFLVENASIHSKLAIDLCKKSNFGGADGIISYQRRHNQISVDLFNSDGSAAGFSGNGFACVAMEVFRTSTANRLTLESSTILLQVEKSHDGIRLILPKMESNLSEKYPFLHSVRDVPYRLIYVGNEHAVFFDTVDSSKVQSYFADPTLFPDGININLAKIIHAQEIDLVVIERGCGLTPACTSGALATVIAAIAEERCSPPVNVRQSGGLICIDMNSEGRFVVDLNPELLGKYQWDGKIISALI